MGNSLLTEKFQLLLIHAPRVCVLTTKQGGTE